MSLRLVFASTRFGIGVKVPEYQCIDSVGVTKLTVTGTKGPELRNTHDSSPPDQQVIDASQRERHRETISAARQGPLTRLLCIAFVCVVVPYCSSLCTL